LQPLLSRCRWRALAYHTFNGSSSA
jgi:hypothetical protein